MVNTLTKVRADVKDALNVAGLNAFEYVQEAFTPPACIVLPDNPYVTAPVGNNPFNKPYSVRLQILIIGGKGTNRITAEQIDSMLVSVVGALEDDWEISEVQAPQEVSLRGVAYIGSVVTLAANTNLEKEDSNG